MTKNNEIKISSAASLDELMAALQLPGHNEKVTVVADADFFESIYKLQDMMPGKFIWAPMLNGPSLWKGDLWKIEVKDYHENIIDYMTFDHRRVDELFASAENLWNEGKEKEATQNLLAFDFTMRCHLAKEEDILFPEFIEKTGMRGGPVQVMLMEHNQIKELLKQMVSAVNASDMDTALAVADTMLILIQQHNMKEEGILYPMIRQHCGIGSDMIKTLQNYIV